MASAQHTPQAIARWVREHRADLFAALPPTVSRLPGASTIRRTLARLDVAALETGLGRLPSAAATPAPTPRPHPHRCRGWRSMAKPSVASDVMGIRAIWSLWCSMATRRVLGQVEVAHKRDERSAVPALLKGRDLRGKVLTLDALHTLRPTARQIRAQHGHYLMIVKKNQAALYAYLDMLFTLPAHPADREVWETVGPTTEKGHGRLETRSLTCGNAHIEDVDWPDVQQVVRRECERIILKTGKRTCEVTYGLVSMPPEEAGAARSRRCGAGIGRLRIGCIMCATCRLAKTLGMPRKARPRMRSPRCAMVCSCCFARLTGVGSRCARALRGLRDPCLDPHWPRS